jgi:hypothetical protein
MNTKTNEIYERDPVINANDIRVHVLNIDSRSRDSILEPATNCPIHGWHSLQNAGIQDLLYRLWTVDQM